MYLPRLQQCNSRWTHYNWNSNNYCESIVVEFGHCIINHWIKIAVGKNWGLYGWYFQFFCSHSCTASLVCVAFSGKQIIISNLYVCLLSLQTVRMWFYTGIVTTSLWVVRSTCSYFGILQKGDMVSVIISAVTLTNVFSTPLFYLVIWTPFRVNKYQIRSLCSFT